MSTEPRRWEPDAQLVSSVLASPKAAVSLPKLRAPDRNWLVAHLTLHGLTAEEIADRLSCSRRLVMVVRAEPATMVATAARVECVELERDLRAERCRHGATRQRVAELEAELSRVRGQRDALVEQAARLRASAAERALHPGRIGSVS